MKNRNLNLALVVLTISSFLFAVSLEARSEHILPAEVRDLLARELHSWRILELSDLHPDDQQFWRQKHDREPPGIAVGHFESPDELSYAIILIREQNGKRRQTLVVVSRGRSKRYKLRRLAEDEIDYPSAVSSVPPGRYTDASRTSAITTKFDSILYESMEVSSQLYYWKNGMYRMLPFTE